MVMRITVVRGETTKILAQRWVAILLVWIWPIGGIVLPLVLVVLSLLNPPDAQQSLKPTFLWTETALSTWFVPTNLFGRLLFISLASAIFSGEYQWHTWKNIVPRAGRTRLILAKFIAFPALLLFGFRILSVLLTIGIGIIQGLRGMAYPAAPTAEVLQTFGRDYLLQAALTLVNTLIGVAFGAILATLTRAILGGVIGGLLFVAGEIGFIAGVKTLGLALNSPELAGLMQFTSAISIRNIDSWIRTGQPILVPPQIEGEPTSTLAGSFVVLIVWLVGLIALNLWI